MALGEVSRVVVRETLQNGEMTGLKFVVRDCGGFPDCLFHSLLYVLQHELAEQVKITNTKQLRLLISSNLREQGPSPGWKEDFKEVLKFQKVPMASTWEEYCNMVATLLCGGTIEIRALLKSFPNIQIRIITSTSKGFFTLGEPNAKRIVRLYYVPHQFHYQALLHDAPILQVGLPSLPKDLAFERGKIQEAIKILCNPVHQKLWISNFGGIGKTIFSLLIAHTLSSTTPVPWLERAQQNDLQKMFPGGLVWIHLGKDCNLNETWKEKIQSLVLALDYKAKLSSADVRALSLGAGLNALPSLTYDRRILFIFDDSWSKCNNAFIPKISQGNGIIFTSRSLPTPQVQKQFLCMDITPNLSFALDIVRIRLGCEESWIKQNIDDLTLLVQKCLFFPLLISFCCESIQDNMENFQRFVQEALPEPPSDISPDSIEESLYVPIIDTCFKMKVDSSFQTLEVLQSLSIFPRTNFPLPFTIIQYWMDLYTVSNGDAKNMFDSLVRAHLISLNIFSQRIGIHDVIYDTICRNTTEETKQKYINQLSESYLKGIIRSQNLPSSGHLEWNNELLHHGPQDDYFFLHTKEITGLSTSCSEARLAKQMSTQNVNVDQYSKMFSYCLSKPIKEAEFLSLDLPRFWERNFRPAIFLSRRSDWSAPDFENLGLVHLVCLFGTPAMLKKIVDLGIYLGCIAESSCTQRMPMEIVIERKDVEMMDILLCADHCGMDLASCSVSYSRSRSWQREGQSPWSCVSSIQFALCCGFSDFAISLVEHNASLEPMSGNISCLEIALEYGQFGFLEYFVETTPNTLSANLWGTLDETVLLDFTSNPNLPRIVLERCKHLKALRQDLVKKRLQSIEDGSAITIIVKSLIGTSFDIKVIPEISIWDVKTLIFYGHGYPVEQQRLIFKGKQLEDQRIVSEYNMVDNDQINIVVRLRGGR